MILIRGRVNTVDVHDAEAGRALDAKLQAAKAHFNEKPTKPQAQVPAPVTKDLTLKAQRAPKTSGLGPFGYPLAGEQGEA
jgi:hypothetical protein